MTGASESPSRPEVGKGPVGDMKFLFCGLISERENMAKSRTGRFLSDSPGANGESQDKWKEV